MTSRIFSPLYWLSLVLLFHWTANSVGAVRWGEETCSGDNMMVTFSKCCGNEPYCSANKKESDCNNGESGLYCQWDETDEEGKDNTGECVPKPDDRSDVCCRGGAVKDACHSIAFKMECPKDWLVTKGCCPDSEERKYSKILGGIPNDMDCCNSPCTQVEKAISNGNSNCTLSARCAPGPRSYAMTYDPYHTLGFFHKYRHGAPHNFGSIIHGTGYGDPYDYEDEYDHDGYEDEHDGYEDEHETKDHKYGHDDHHKHGYGGQYDHSKYRHVDEITVDDLFELLIESLEEDTDVKTYNAEYFSDPYLGKTKSGGLLASLNLPNPDYYIDMLYGTPWGHNYNLDYEFLNPAPIYSLPPYHYGPSYFGEFHPYFDKYRFGPHAGYGDFVHQGHPLTFPPSYQAPLPVQQYGPLAQHGYDNQQYAATSMYGSVNQYPIQPKPQQQPSYQQQQPKVNVQQAHPVQQPIPVNGAGVQYNQNPNQAAEQYNPQAYAAPIAPIYGQ